MFSAFTGEAPDTLWSKLIGGVLVPVWLAYVGVSYVRGGLTGLDPGTTLFVGRAAVAGGVAWLALALFLHAHYLWSNLRWLACWASRAKTAAAVVFIPSFVYSLFAAAWNFFG